MHSNYDYIAKNKLHQRIRLILQTHLLMFCNLYNNTGRKKWIDHNQFLTVIFMKSGNNKFHNKIDQESKKLNATHTLLSLHNPSTTNTTSQ